MDDKLFEDKAEVRQLEQNRGRRSDQLCVMFETEYQLSFGIPYRHQSGDFVQLARLLRTATEISDEYWMKAVRNYLTSALSKFTLADLASRVEVFHRDRLDRYGKPYSAQAQGSVAALTDWMNRDE